MATIEEMQDRFDAALPEGARFFPNVNDPSSSPFWVSRVLVLSPTRVGFNPVGVEFVFHLDFEGDPIFSDDGKGVTIKVVNSEPGRVASFDSRFSPSMLAARIAYERAVLSNSLESLRESEAA